MTEVREKRALFGHRDSSSPGADRGKPPPPPKNFSLQTTQPAPPQILRNGSSPSPSPSPSFADSRRESGGDRVSKLSPSLLKNLEKTSRLSPGPAVIKGGIAGARTPSPAPKKKSKSASKLPVPPPREKSTELAPNKLGVGLLASVTRDLRASTGNLDSISFSSSTSSTSSNRQSSAQPLRGKSSSPQTTQKTRKTAALSMDVSRVTPHSRDKSPRPFSTAATHRTALHSSHSAHPSLSPALPRIRNDSFDSFDDSYSPPNRSPVPQSPSNNTLLVSRPHPQVSRSIDNLLEGSSQDPKPTKVRSNSDATPPSVGPETRRKPRPAPPPKKPGLAAMATKPAPPPKPHIKQLKKSPDFSRRISNERGLPHERSRSTSATSDPSPSPTTTKPRPFSPGEPSSAPQPPPRGGEVSPLPSTPSPRTSQLEAVRRNADSGFASETAEDPSSPLETAVAISNRPVADGDEETGVESEEPLCKPPPEVWDEARLEKARNKRFHIAEELLKTEATYVERLHVIAVRFHDAVITFNSQNKNVIPEGDINRIFLNISQIHNLNTNILEELQKRMGTWDTREGLGDVIERLAPFLKLYAHYAAGFEDAMKMLTSWTKREKKFDTVVREFERELATGLGVAHYMLEPVQRIPRYRLLLADYLKYTPPDSPDRQPTENALEMISEAADHSNDRIKVLENSNTILSIQRSLQDFEGTLLAPGRLFFRRGHLQKFSRKTTTPRMFFLFSDMLLHTEPAGTDVYKFKNEMPLFMMRVEEPVVALVPYSFNVESTTRSLILVASSEAEKREWMTDLRKAINEERKKRASLRREMSIKVEPGVFGAQAPIMVPDKSVTMCQACSALFTFTFRRHHCRGCGKVVCGSCSQLKTYLHYLKKSERVCEKCYCASRSESGEEVDAPPSPRTSRRRREGAVGAGGGGGGVLDLKGYEEDTIKGGYVLSQDGRKWTRLWYQLKQDFCLYKFRAHEDIKAISCLPLPGYVVKSDHETCTITLTHPSSNKKELSDTFRPENSDDFDFWVLALESVVQLEVPSLPPDTKLYSPPLLDERTRSHSLRDINAVATEGDSPLEKSL